MELTRREFLKDTAVVSAAAGLGLGRGSKVLQALTESPVPVAQGEKKLVTVFSPGSGCHHRCVLRVHVVDGRITKAQAAPFPEQPESTHCCVRGLASAALPYYPDRLKYPVKRVGARGEGNWEPISWDEALDTIAQKLNEVRDQYGPQAVMIGTGGSSVVPNSGTVNSGAEAIRFTNLWGATISAGWGCDTSPEVADFFTHGQDWDRGDPRGMMHSNLIIVWGANPAESALRDMKFIGMARRNGATLVDIGPIHDATAAAADWWIPIRPATDAALGMAMVQVIVSEGLHNQEYLRRYSVGPLLVRDDNGMLLREADFVGGGSQEKFVAWDEASQHALVVDQAQHDVPETVALTGTFTVEGIACRPALQKLVDEVNQNYTPEQAAEITNVPADTIRELARRYALAKPAAIFTNYGLGRYYHGNLSHRAQLALATICGYLGELGGGVQLGGGAESERIWFNTAAVHQPTDMSSTELVFDKVIQAIKTGDPYPIKMWILTFANDIQCINNTQRWLNDVIPNLDFIVNINIRLDYTAQFADIVLPDATIYERVTVSAVQDHVVLSGPAIEPLFEARTTNWIWSELAKRVGLGEYFQYSDEDYIRMMLDSEDPSLAGITLEKLREAGGMLRANVPKEPYVALSAKQFDTPTGRLEFYAERLLPYQEALPVFKPSLEVPYSPDPQYPLQLFTGRKRYYMQTMLGDIPVLHRFVPEPLLQINPQDAVARGIQDSDMVEVFNNRGRMVLKALQTPAMPPGAVWTSHGPGPQEFEEGHYQLLTLPCYSEATRNPVHDIRWEQTRPWWKWAGGQTDVLFDNAVEVRKL
jgi:anaerobic selenocysteine-containing dehydrogenase